ncbi:MAG: hypothetical protein ACRENS_01925 [Candidatus Eiseniibacteriota bacterium]
MNPRRLALVNQSSRNISFDDVSRVARALQIQCDRDFTPIWGMAAVVVPLGTGEKVPAGYWPMRVLDKPVGGLGIHLDKNHHPYAEIMATSDWPVTASHEMVEMLADPYGNHFMSAPDIDPHSDHHRVHYLVEVADPCETWEYSIEGVAVSDFVTPEYYNPDAEPGTSFDHLGRLKTALEVPRGGYISWIDPEDGRWHQKQIDGTFVRARVNVSATRNPREDRDRAFGNDPQRHDLSAIRSGRRHVVPGNGAASGKRRRRSD